MDENLNHIEQATHRIANIVITNIKRAIQQSKFDFGLLSGVLGGFIFWGHYLKHYPNPSSYNDFLSSIEEYCLKLSASPLQLNYNNGIAGIIKGIELLNDSKLVSIDDSLINTAKPQAVYYLTNYLNETNIDFLYGSIGIAYGFCADEEICKLFISLVKERVNLSKIFNRSHKLGCPFGSAHGIASLFSILCKLIEICKDKNIISSIIKDFVNIATRQIVDVNKYGSYFPASFNSIKSQSDLGWCKGDLSLSLVLLKISLVLEIQSLRDLSIEILYNCAKRVLSNNDGLDNYTVCHGSAGIGLLFDEAYNFTHEAIFNRVEKICLYKSAQFINDGIIQQKPYKHFTMKTDILEGISGLGLYMIDSYSKSSLRKILLL